MVQVSNVHFHMNPTRSYVIGIFHMWIRISTCGKKNMAHEIMWNLLLHMLITHLQACNWLLLHLQLKCEHMKTK